MHHHMQNCTANQCESQKPACSSAPQQQPSMLEELMSAAKCAKKELMKEKIKAQLEKQIGGKMDEVAKLAADMFIGCWSAKMDACAKKEEAMKKMKEIMSV